VTTFYCEVLQVFIVERETGPTSQFHEFQYEKWKVDKNPKKEIRIQR
jgi:hypothetical protein